MPQYSATSLCRLVPGMKPGWVSSKANRDGNTNCKHFKPLSFSALYADFLEILGQFPYSAACAHLIISSPCYNETFTEEKLFQWPKTNILYFSFAFYLILSSLRLWPSLPNPRIINSRDGVYPEPDVHSREHSFWYRNKEHLDHFVLLLEKIPVSNYCAVSIRSSLITKAAC